MLSVPVFDDCLLHDHCTTLSFMQTEYVQTKHEVAEKHWSMQLTINVSTVNGRTKKGTERTMKQLLMHIIYTYAVEKYDFGLIIKLSTHCQHTVQ